MHQILDLALPAYDELFEEINLENLVENKGILYVWNDKNLKVSPKPSISLSNKGLIASGVTSLAVIPVPPVVIITSIFGSVIQSLVYFLIK